MAIFRQIDGLFAYAGRLGCAVFDPPGRFPFHQVGHPRLPRYLWPLEQVFHPRFAFGIALLGLDNNCFTNFESLGRLLTNGFLSEMGMLRQFNECSGAHVKSADVSPDEPILPVENENDV